MRAPALAALRQGPWRQARLELVWHDGPGRELAHRGMALARERGTWRLERLVPNGTADWPPAGAAPILAEAPNPEALGIALPERLVPVAAFTGRRRRVALAGPASLTLLEGAIRGLTVDAPACRLLLEGEPGHIGALARRMAAETTLELAPAGLAAAAAALAAGGEPAPRHLGAPTIPDDSTVEHALEIVLIHLADVVLHWARLVPTDPGPEAVHQMRVALRRLRAALGVFRPVANGEAIHAIADRLRTLSQTLGAARDWDVFAAGPASELPQILPAETGLARLRAAAERQRAVARAALRAALAGPEWQALAFDLALLPTLRPWRTAASPEQIERAAAPVRAFAAQALDRRHRNLLAPGTKLEALSDAALHDLRKQAKRMRYAAELFAPLHPGKPARRYLRRLAAVQAAFGRVNDAATAAMLLRGLPGGFAAGVVRGYLAAGAPGQRAAAGRSWKKFARTEPFWH